MENEDARECRGNYESAMHYDCMVCNAKDCIFRKTTSSILGSTVLCIIAVAIVATVAFICYVIRELPKLVENL